jgi:hypothetical protein
VSSAVVVMAFHGGVLQPLVCFGVVSLTVGARPLRCDCVGSLHGGGSQRALRAGGGDHLGHVAVPRCSGLHAGGREGGECFCGSVFLSGMDFFWRLVW